MSMVFSDGSAPIPGENYTSDTKNYPWHQPPEFRSITEALDKMSVKLTEPETARHIMAFAEAGFPLVRIAQMIIMEGISQGKWTVDMGLLLAGPFTKIFEIMCDSYDIDYTIGIEKKAKWNTGNYYKAITMLKQEGNKMPNFGQVVDEQMPKIESAAEAQSQPTGNDAGGTSDAGGQQDLGMQGFAVMTSGAPGSDSGQKNMNQQKGGS